MKDYLRARNFCDNWEAEFFSTWEACSTSQSPCSSDDSDDESDSEVEVVQKSKAMQIH